MAKEIVWSRKALNDRKNILNYWIDRNESNAYSLKLNELFKQAVLLIAEHPGIGKPTTLKNIKVKIVRDYFIFYQETNQEIYIISIWDTRQSPAKLKVT